MIPFATVIRSGESPNRSVANHVARAPEAGDHLVEDEQHLALAADLLHAVEVALGRDQHAAGADHGLGEERGDVVGADLVDRRRERLGVVPRHLLDLGNEPPVVVGQRRIPPSEVPYAFEPW